MKNIICIDVSGKDILIPHYAICIVLNDKYCYGYRLETELQNKLVSGYRLGAYNLECKKSYINLKIRLYSSIVALLLDYAYSRHLLNDYVILMCNDFDGHFNDIIQFLQSNTRLQDIAKNTLLHRHSEESFIQKAAKDLAKGKTNNISLVHISLKDIEKLIRKKHKR